MGHARRSHEGRGRRPARAALAIATVGLVLVFGPPIFSRLASSSDADRATVVTFLDGRWLLPPGNAPATDDELAALREALRMAGGEAESLPEGRDGVSLDRISSLLREAGLEATWYDAPPRRLATLPVPFLAVAEVSGAPRLVLIVDRRQGWFYLVEPERGRTLAPYRWLSGRAMGPVLPLAESAPP